MGLSTENREKHLTTIYAFPIYEALFTKEAVCSDCSRRYGLTKRHQRALKVFGTLTEVVSFAQIKHQSSCLLQELEIDLTLRISRIHHNIKLRDTNGMNHTHDFFN